MNKSKIFKIILLITTISLVLLLGTKVFGTEPEDGTNLISDIGEPTVPNENENSQTNTDEEEVHEGDLYIGSTKTNYVMDKLVDGNAFIFGQNVKITGKVNGSVFILASGNVEIDKDAYIACQLFVFADDVTINGMALDVYAAGQTLELGESALIYRDMKATFDKIKLAGNIGRDVSLYSENITAPEEGLNIYGDLKYEAKSKIVNEDKIQMGGKITYTPMKEKTKGAADVIINGIFGALGTIIFDVLLYIALIFIAPKFIEKSKEYVSTKGLLAFAIGLAFLVIVPIIAFLLLLTGFLGGLGVFMLFVYAAVLMINAFVFSIIANEFIASKLNIEDKLKKGFLLVPVSLVLWLIRKIPVIGSLISIIVCLCGIGVVAYYQFDKRRQN